MTCCWWELPEIVFGCEKLSTGCIVAGLSHAADVQVITGLSDDTVDYERQLNESLPLVRPQTMFVFVDGLAGRVGTLVQDLFNVYGLEFNYIGGGAGSLSFQPKPCIFTQEGLVQDCAVLAMVPIDSGIGVRHWYWHCYR